MTNITSVFSPSTENRYVTPENSSPRISPISKAVPPLLLFFLSGSHGRESVLIIPSRAVKVKAPLLQNRFLGALLTACACRAFFEKNFPQPLQISLFNVTIMKNFPDSFISILFWGCYHVLYAQNPSFATHSLSGDGHAAGGCPCGGYRQGDPARVGAAAPQTLAAARRTTSFSGTTFRVTAPRRTRSSSGCCPTPTDSCSCFPTRTLKCSSITRSGKM